MKTLDSAALASLQSSVLAAAGDSDVAFSRIPLVAGARESVDPARAFAEFIAGSRAFVLGPGTAVEALVFIRPSNRGGERVSADVSVSAIHGLYPADAIELGTLLADRGRKAEAIRALVASALGVD